MKRTLEGTNRKEKNSGFRARMRTQMVRMLLRLAETKDVIVLLFNQIYHVLKPPGAKRIGLHPAFRQSPERHSSEWFSFNVENLTQSGLIFRMRKEQQLTTHPAQLGLAFRSVQSQQAGSDVTGLNGNCGQLFAACRLRHHLGGVVVLFKQLSSTRARLPAIS